METQRASTLAMLRATARCFQKPQASAQLATARVRRAPAALPLIALLAQLASLWKATSASIRAVLHGLDPTIPVDADNAPPTAWNAPVQAPAPSAQTARFWRVASVETSARTPPNSVSKLKWAFVPVV